MFTFNAIIVENDLFLHGVYKGVVLVVFVLMTLMNINLSNIQRLAYFLNILKTAAVLPTPVLRAETISPLWLNS